MQTAKLFMNGNSQAVRLPMEFRFPGDEVGIQKVGDLVYLFPKDKAWEIFLKGLDSVSDDLGDAILEGRSIGLQSERESL